MSLGKSAVLLLALVSLCVPGTKGGGLHISLGSNRFQTTSPRKEPAQPAQPAGGEDDDVDNPYAIGALWMAGQRYPGREEPHPCHRTCTKGARPMKCEYKFVLESHVTMGRPCGNCLRNLTACANPQCATADGGERGVYTVNRRIIGPSINVCVGDTVIIHVENSFQGRGGALHWHGIRQIGTQFSDGVVGLTQCPISEGSTFTYRFIPGEAGTYFWHSHNGFEKMDGIVGGLTVRTPYDPHLKLYDYDHYGHTLIVLDWFRIPSDEHFPGLQGENRGQKPNAYLVNGRGSSLLPNSTDPPKAPYALFEVTKGKCYRFRLVGGTCGACPVLITMQNHRMRLIAVELTSIEPVWVDSITLFAGERADAVVCAEHAVGVYWIHIRAQGFCTGIQQFAVLRYHGAETGATLPLPTLDSPKGVVYNPLNSVCDKGSPNEVCSYQLKNIRNLKNAKLGYPADKRLDFTFGFHDITPEDTARYGPYMRYLYTPPNAPVAATINNITNVFGPSPMLTQPDDGRPERVRCENCVEDEEFCQCLHIEKLPYRKHVDFIIADGAREGLEHPFHLHGYEFFLLTQRLFKPNETVADVWRALDAGEIELASCPVEKDTLPVPSAGYVIARLFTDNVGYWLLHCHFIFHLTAGMSVVLQVGSQDQMPQPPSGFPVCNDFVQH